VRRSGTAHGRASAPGLLYLPHVRLSHGLFVVSSGISQPQLGTHLDKSVGKEDKAKENVTQDTVAGGSVHLKGAAELSRKSTL
jgi:hypothetical protein